MIAMSLYSFCFPLLAGGISMVLYRTHGRFESIGHKEFWRGATGLVLAIGVTSSVLLVSLAALLERTWQVPTLVRDTIALSPYLVTYLLFDLHRVRWLLRLDAWTLLVADSWFAVGSLAVILAVRFDGPESTAWATAFAAGPIIGLAYLLWRDGQAGFVLPIWSRRLVSAIGPTLFTFSLANAGTWLTRTSDRWLLASFLVEPAQIAYYTVGIQASMLLLFPVEQLASALLPIIANVSKVADLSVSHRKLLWGAILGSMAVLPLIGLPLGWLYFHLLYPPAYGVHGWPVFEILLIGIALVPISTISRVLLARFGRPGRVLVLDWLGAVTLLALGVVLLGVHRDISSAAWARVGAFGVLAIAYWTAISGVLRSPG